MDTNQWSVAERNLADDERELARRNLDEAGVLSDVPAGVLKQVIWKGLDSLSSKQLAVYENQIRLSLVEKCGGPCNNFVPTGVDKCHNCSLEY